MRSTALAGWLVVSCMMPWPSRMRDVRWLAAARNTGGRGVAVLLEEVVLHHPGVVVAQLIGQLELVEGVVVQPPLAVRLPGTRQLQLVEHAELHGPPCPADRTPPGNSRGATPPPLLGPVGSGPLLDPSQVGEQRAGVAGCTH